MQILHGGRFENPCTLCSAVSYCCGAVAPCAIAALLGRFLPRLGPLVIFASGPFFLSSFWARAPTTASCAGLTRASITLRKSLSKGMDCRVKPGNDESQGSGCRHCF